jgi:hypothetical protein
MPAKLKHGVVGASGGARAGAGRKPSEFLEKCRQIASNPKYFAWAERVLADEPTEDRLIVVNNVPQIEKVRASAGEKDRVWSSLAAYGFGKPVQSVELSGEVSGRMVIVRSEQ